MYDLINYYSVTDNIIQLTVDFRHILLYVMKMMGFFVLFCYVMLAYVCVR